MHTFVSDENSDHFGWLGIACIGGNDVYRARWFATMRLSSLLSTLSDHPKVFSDKPTNAEVGSGATVRP